MTRKLNRHLIYLMLAMIIIITATVTAGAPSFAAHYNDTVNHWANAYIETVSTYGAVSGYSNGNFKPNSPIKRIEFIAIVTNALELDLREPTPNEYWGEPYLEAALKSGLIGSNEYGDMTAEAYISREEMASVVVEAYTISGGLVDSAALDEAKAKLIDFDAVTTKYYDKAVASVALGFISGHSNGTFSPKASATRAQAAVLTFKLLVKLGDLTEADLPENIMLSKEVLTQGDLLKISVAHVDDASVITIDQPLYSDFQWYDTGSTILGYIPTNYSSKPGVYTLQFTNTLTGRTSTRQIEIVERNFRVQRLTVDTSVESSTRTDDAYAEYRKYYNPARENSSPTKYYSESFLLPTRGKVTTEFGESRYVNGSLTTYRHAGIDIAAPRHTEVISTNSGKVVLSMPLILTGNSIIIDHGEGLFSVYLHLEKLAVTEGELVDRGQLIGTVGSTGFSTGPHLHFTMSYYRFDLEPGFLIYGQSITKQNYLELMK